MLTRPIVPSVTEIRKSPEPRCSSVMSSAKTSIEAPSSGASVVAAEPSRSSRSTLRCSNETSTVPPTSPNRSTVAPTAVPRRTAVSKSISLTLPAPGTVNASAVPGSSSTSKVEKSRNSPLASVLLKSTASAPVVSVTPATPVSATSRSAARTAT